MRWMNGSSTGGIGRFGGTLFVVVSLWLSGCSTVSEVELHQPQLAQTQEVMLLTTSQVCWEGDEGTERVLAEFPLPGARIGQPMYLVYLRLPSGAKAIDAADVGGAFAQTHGRKLRVVSVADGHIDVSAGLWPDQDRRSIKVDLTFEDETRLVGTIIAQRDSWHIRRFETRQHPDMVRLVTMPRAKAE